MALLYLTLVFNGVSSFFFLGEYANMILMRCGALHMVVYNNYLYIIQDTIIFVVLSVAIALLQLRDNDCITLVVTQWTSQ